MGGLKLDCLQQINVENKQKASREKKNEDLVIQRRKLKK